MQVELGRTIVGLCNVSKIVNTKIWKLKKNSVDSSRWYFGHNSKLPVKFDPNLGLKASAVHHIRAALFCDQASLTQNQSPLNGEKLMVPKSLFRRELPSPPAIDYASPDGKKLFTEAFNDGSMEGFLKLMSCFQTQSEITYCGLASLSMILNALAIDPNRKWKDGPWRWFDESMLACYESLEQLRAEGASFDTVVRLASCEGANVEAFRTTQSSIDEFRKHVLACTTSQDYHMISLYHRGVLGQTGSGHYSPIGGYHAEKDMVLILDVARFKYPPHWVPLPLLWNAMDTVVPASILRRGFIIISKLHKSQVSVYTLISEHKSWTYTAKYLTNDVPMLINSNNLKSVRDVLSTIFFSLPSDFSKLITWLIVVRRREDDEMLKLLRETNLHKHVCCEIERILGQSDSDEVNLTIIEKKVFLTALLMALPSQTWSSIKYGQVLEEILSLVSTDALSTQLQDDILCLRESLCTQKMEQ